MFTGLSATFNVYGKSFMRLNAVYLSGAPLSGTTLYNPFSALPKLSATYPGFNGYKLPPTAYTTNFDNTITINIPAPVRAGYIDVIAQNIAGYGILTRYVVKQLYTNIQPLSTLRPWYRGIEVTGADISTEGVENQMLTITGDNLVTISGDNIISI